MKQCKPIPNASNVCTASTNVQPIIYNVSYYIKLRAVAGVAKSDDTTSLNPFNRVPGGPSKVIVK